jgi:hypothetical protein
MEWQPRSPANPGRRQAGLREETPGIFWEELQKLPGLCAEFGHFTGTEARVPVARAEGPAVSSHARQGVVCGADDMEVRRTGTNRCRSAGPGEADCFAAALAKQRRVELVTGDKEFKQVEKEIRILWL